LGAFSQCTMKLAHNMHLIGDDLHNFIYIPIHLFCSK
jgi:hypothetical protein